jgi:hypothetical protein
VLKRSRRQAVYLPPSKAEVEYAWSDAPLLPHSLHGIVLNGDIVRAQSKIKMAGEYELMMSCRLCAYNRTLQQQ